MTEQSRTHPGRDLPRPYALLSDYHEAKAKSYCYLALSYTLENIDTAWQANDASEDQTHIYATLETKIAETGARDLKDVYAKLVIMKDGLARTFKRRSDLEIYEAALETALEWVQAHAFYEIEALSGSKAPERYAKEKAA